MVPPQGAAHFGQKPIVGSVGQVDLSHPGGIAPSAGPAADHHRSAPGPATGDQAALVAKGIDRVDDHIVPGFEQSIRRGLGEEFDAGPDIASGMDGADPVREHLRLETSHRPVEREQLAVHIAEADLVEVDEGQAADPGTGEGFDHPRSDAPETDHADMGGLKTLHRTRTVQVIHGTKAGENVVRHGPT